MSADNISRLVAAYGSLPITGTELLTVPEGIDFNCIVADELGITITTIRVQDKKTLEVTKYADKSGALDWDGQSIGGGGLIEIPSHMRLYSIQLATGNAKGILDKGIVLKSI